MTDPINIPVIEKILAENKGKFMTVVFVKKDGSLRKLNGRRGVKKHVKGGESTIKDHSNLVSIYDEKAKGYRCFDKTRVTEIHAGGKVYKFF